MSFFTQVNIKQDSGLFVASGGDAAYSSVNKFGAAPDFDTGDGEVVITDLANDAASWQVMDYVYSTTADIDRVSSSSASDTGDVEIQGLDTSGTLTVQTVTLNGQTPVALTTSLKRVFRVKNTGSSDFVGNVFVFVNGTTTGGVPDTANDIRAAVRVGNNQTEMAVYTVPTGKTAYMRSFYVAQAGASKSTNYVFQLYARPNGGVFQLKHRLALPSDTAPIQHVYDPPQKFSAMTDLEMTCEVQATGVTQASVIAGFDLVLIDD